MAGLAPDRPGDALGLVAGGGSLPRLVAEAARRSGWRPVVVRIGDGMADDWSGYEGGAFAWGRTGDAIAYMKSCGVRRMVFCGTVSHRPDFRALIPSFQTLIRLPAALKIVRGGDDRLLRALSRYMEKQGFEMIAVQDIAPSLLTPCGTLTRRAPGRDEEQALTLATRAAHRLGALDIGQAVVASADRVVALEGIEGTREMLLRVADLKTRGRIGRSERCVLVKIVKPTQDERFDLPSIGDATIAEAAAAGISAIGITAGRSLVLGIDDVLAAAEAKDIAIVGLDDSQEETLDNGGERNRP
ncbi:UDP-2,3-diacylglucosamine diphosphatase LpxI [Aurantimonas sp. A2-1-M11]|uniref:LpxI family protein n=1 Tax=Aurantimonas sp. A2-1-M11 TaxID=3113712 RepID=UPI002F94FE2D